VSGALMLASDPNAIAQQEQIMARNEREKFLSGVNFMERHLERSDRILSNSSRELVTH